MLNYCRELSVPLEIFVNEADGSYFYYEGAVAGSLAKTSAMRLREVKADIVGQVNELLVKAIDQHSLDLPLTAEDQDRLVRFTCNAGATSMRKTGTTEGF